MVGLKVLAGLALVSAAAAVDGSLPSIREMLDDWDAKQAAKAAGVKWSPTPRTIEMPSKTKAVTAPDHRDRRQANRVGQLEGVFVTPCNVSQSWFGGGSPTEVAQAKTTQYNVSSNPRSNDNQNGTYEVDYTEYVGGTCDPAGGGYDAQAFAKYNLQGTVMYQGTVQANTGICPTGVTCYRAEWTTTSSTWVFPEDPTTEPDVSRLLNILNNQCPCHGEWTAGAAGARTITNRQCHRDQVDPNGFILCGIIAGLPTYANYEYVDTGSAVIQYRSSPLSFVQQEGWSTAPTSRPRTRLPKSGVHYTSDCNYIKYSPAYCGVKGGVESDIANYCDGCSQLECTGCAYRFIEKSKKRPAIPPSTQPMSPEIFWTDCCPCSWAAAERLGHPWMKFDC